MKIIEKILYKFGYIHIDRVHEVVDPLFDKYGWISELNKAVENNCLDPVRLILREVREYYKLLADMEDMMFLGKLKGDKE